MLPSKSLLSVIPDGKPFPLFPELLILRLSTIAALNAFRVCSAIGPRFRLVLQVRLLDCPLIGQSTFHAIIRLYIATRHCLKKIRNTFKLLIGMTNDFVIRMTTRLGKDCGAPAGAIVSFV